MGYYFEVVLNNIPGSRILVEAEDVIEAGKKVATVFGAENIIEITRSKIDSIFNA
jgi:hypothetical protein